MLILTIRTDQPDAELGLFDDKSKLAYSTWLAHRHLAETIHSKIRELLESQSRSFDSLNAIAVYKGPGSFTGLRIGLTVANTLADSLGIAIVSESGDGWLEKAKHRLVKGENEKLALPEYGSLPNITLPKK